MTRRMQRRKQAADHLPPAAIESRSAQQGGPQALLQLQQQVGNQAVQRLLASQAGAAPMGLLLQRIFDPGTYAEATERGYVQIVDKAAGDYLQVQSSPQHTSIIKRGSMEDRHLSQAPTGGMTITQVTDEIYRVKTFGKISSTIYITKAQLTDVPHLTWSMQQAKEQPGLAKEILDFITSIKDQQYQDYLKSKMECLGDLDRVKAIHDFLSPIDDLSYSDYLKTTLGQLNNDLDRVKAIHDFLSPINDQPHRDYLKKTLGQLNHDLDHVKAIHDLLGPINDQLYREFLKTLLGQLNHDVDQAKQIHSYLEPYHSQGPKLFGLAKRELALAGNKVGDAEPRMKKIEALFGWAKDQSTTEAEEEYESTKTQAKETRDSEINKIKGDYPKAIFKGGKLSQQNKKKLGEYKKKIEPHETTFTDTIKQAEITKDTRTKDLRDENEQFVSDVTANGADIETVEWLIEQTKNQKQLVVALQTMMSLQNDPQSRDLVTSVLGSKDPQATAALCTALLKGGAGEEQAFNAAEYSLSIKDNTIQTWIHNQALSDSVDTLTDKISYLKKHNSHLKGAFAVLEELGVADNIYRLEGVLNQKVDLLKWVVSLNSEKYFKNLVMHLDNTQDQIQTLKDIFDYNDNHQTYAGDQLVAWIRLYGSTKLLSALQNTSGFEVIGRLVELYIEFGATTSSSVQFLHLIRIQSLLESNPGVNPLQVYKKDRWYKKNNDKRTGFLECNFTNGDRAEIHTHWDIPDLKLVSMHVQDNQKNGVEINTWSHFDLVKKAVQKAHNSSVAYPPTGGKLKL